MHKLNISDICVNTIIKYRNASFLKNISLIKIYMKKRLIRELMSQLAVILKKLRMEKNLEVSGLKYLKCLVLTY
jgi:hypothetical protein